VTAARETVAAIVVERERRLFGFCIYGGEPCRGLTCAAHRDLLNLDSNTYLMRLRTGAERKQA